MADTTQLFHDYRQKLERELASGNASERSHYPALKALLQSLEPGLLATVEAPRIACGAPDFILSRRQATIGYVEAKDVGMSLDEAEKSDQLKRYRESLPNLIFTDFLEFRWYVDGQERGRARLGRAEAWGHLTPKPPLRMRRGGREEGRQGAAEVAALLSDFLAYRAPSPANPRELAQRLARLCRMTREIMVGALGQEPEAGTLHGQLAAFRDVLIPDLTEAQFADMYAQTIAYGLFAARTMTDNPATFTRQNAAYLLPRTNPFLRQLFGDIAGPNLDDRIAWLVDDLAQLLAGADMAGILADFGRRTRQEDPVVHFYETFLAAYDPKIREMRGVYYTPEPVVSYIVRSVDGLLRTRFGRPDGLADSNTLVLDPAAGTGTFLYLAIDLIHQRLVEQGRGGAWNDYVAQHLLRRLFGFELLMAPYAVAHLKLGLQLKDLGYQFDSQERLSIYLTNTLGEQTHPAQYYGMGRVLTEEANAAADIKREKPIEVVIGNPPYSVSSLNRGPWIQRLIEDYKKNIREKKLNLDDDYVKFLRFGQWRIEQTGQGILAMITNHAYLDNITFRQMRRSLMDSFSEIYVINLHGNARKREVAPDGGKDENVFDIQQGVAIGVFVKEPGKTGPARVHHADLWGLREGKHDALLAQDVATTAWRELAPEAPDYFFVPQDTQLASEYESGWKVTDIFLVHGSGVKTDRDELCFDFDKDALASRMNMLFSGKYDDDFRRRYRIEPSSSYDVEERARNTAYSAANIQRCLYRSFDQRWLYYQPGFTSRPAYDVMRHMLQENLALIATRQFGGHRHFITLCAKGLTEISSQAYAPYTLFPLYLYEEPREGGLALGSGRRPNLSPAFVAEVERRVGVGVEPHPATASPSPLAERGPGGEVNSAERGPGGEVNSAERGPGGEVNSAERGPGGEVRWRSDPELWARLKPLARQMRKEPTPAENLLWQRLRNRNLMGFRFRRQHAIERFIVDFYCKAACLVVEVEGPVHQYQQEEDQVRQAYLESLGLRVLRFSNDDVLRSTEKVLHQISQALTPPSPPSEPLPPTPSPHAERGWPQAGGEVSSGPGGEVTNGPGSEVFTPEDIFHYAYAVFHSPTYRRRYAEFLKTDFPRLPLTSDRALFKALAQKGAELVSFHLVESPALDSGGPRFDVAGNNLVEQVRYDQAQQRVYVNKQQHFEGIEPSVWEFHVGGYQVCQKWLKDRQGRRLSYEDVRHYQRVVVALRQTIRLMAEIDGLVPAWPLE